MINESAAEREVVAQKSFLAAVIYAVLSAIGLVFLAVGVALFLKTDSEKSDFNANDLIISLLALGIVVTATFAVLCIKQIFRPRNLVLFDGKNFVLPDGSFLEPSRIFSVESSAEFFSTGKITMYIGLEKFKKTVNGVKNFRAAHARIEEIIKETKEI